MPGKLEMVCWPKAGTPDVEVPRVQDLTSNHICREGEPTTLCGRKVRGAARRNPLWYSVGMDCKRCMARLPSKEDCCWCGGECLDGVFKARGGGDEVFCSKSHRDSSARALKRFRANAEAGMGEMLTADQKPARADLDAVVVEAQGAITPTRKD